MEPRLTRLSLFVITAFVLFQLGGVVFPTDPITQGWVIVAGYLVAGVYGFVAKAPIAVLAAISVAVVRAMVTLKIGGQPFNIASMMFADLFFILVIFESEYHRIARVVERVKQYPTAQELDSEHEERDRCDENSGEPSYQQTDQTGGKGRQRHF